MIKRQIRIQRIVAVEQEFGAGRTAAKLLEKKLEADPSFGNAFGWRQRAGEDFDQNLEGTYIIRMYAEFEAALRDYWKTHLGKSTYPKMVQLVTQAIPDQHFPQDCIDNADDVRIYRNFLVHDIEEEVPLDMSVFGIAEAKKHFCAFVACLSPKWK